MKTTMTIIKSVKYLSSLCNFDLLCYMPHSIDNIIPQGEENEYSKKYFIFDYHFVYDLCIYKIVYFDIDNIVNNMRNITGN